MSEKKSQVKKTKKTTEKKEQSRASDPENRERQLINHAVNLAEKQLLEGTASPSVITHYLKLGTTREKLEREILEKQSQLIEAKADNINRDRDAEELAKAAIEAMKGYAPN